MKMEPVEETHTMELTDKEIACAFFAVRDRARLLSESANRFRADTHGFTEPARVAVDLQDKLSRTLQELLEVDDEP